MFSDSKVDYKYHRPDTYDFSSLTREEYLESPELFYQKPEGELNISLMRLGEVGGIEEFNATFVSPVQDKYPENQTASGLYFKAAGKDSLKSIILIHGWGRLSLDVEKKMARKLARNNIDCFLHILPFHFERAPNGSWSGEYSLTGNICRTVEGTRQLVTEVRTVASWLRHQGKKVVMSGISLGGMLAQVAMDVEAFDAGIIIMAGGNNAGIIWNGIATRYIKRDLIKAEISQETASHVYRIINPTVLARHNKTRNIIMINGLYDEAIPKKYVLELWEALGRPKIKWYPCGHASMIFFLDKIVDDIIQYVGEAIK